MICMCSSLSPDAAAPVADYCSAAYNSDRVHARHAVFDRAHMQESVRQVDLIPAQRAHLDRPQPVPIRDPELSKLMPLPSSSSWKPDGTKSGSSRSLHHAPVRAPLLRRLASF